MELLSAEAQEHLSPKVFDEVVRPYVKPVSFEGLSRLMWDVRNLDRFIEERKC